MVFIPQIAESCIRHQPVFIIIEELLVISAIEYSIFLKRIYMVNDLPLYIIHSFIIYSRQFIELLAILFVLLQEMLVFFTHYLTHVEIHGMQRKSRNSCI